MTSIFLLNPTPERRGICRGALVWGSWQLGVSPAVNQAPALGSRASGRLQMVRKRSVLAVRCLGSRLARGRGWSQMVGMRSVVMGNLLGVSIFGKYFHISYLRPRSQASICEKYF